MRRMLILASAFVLCRSDRGDGGWSLHAPDSTDEQIASGDSLALVTGESETVNGEWIRPNESDYRAAVERLAPWASEIIACDGGYQAFESAQDAMVWQKQT